MSTIDAIDRAVPKQAARHAVPDPGEQVPKLALPTVGIYLEVCPNTTAVWHPMNAFRGT